jgi:hypothetical protein
MKAVDYLSIFLLLGSAPTWQGEVDRLAAGLGSALLLLLLLTAVNLVRGEFGNADRDAALRRSFSRASDCRRCPDCPVRQTPAV